MENYEECWGGIQQWIIFSAGMIFLKIEFIHLTRSGFFLMKQYPELENDKSCLYHRHNYAKSSVLYSINDVFGVFKAVK